MSELASSANVAEKGAIAIVAPCAFMSRRIISCTWFTWPATSCSFGSLPTPTRNPGACGSA